MKSEAEIGYAQSKIMEQILKASNEELKTILRAMLSALCWVCEEPCGTTTQKVIDGYYSEDRQRAEDSP